MNIKPVHCIFAITWLLLLGVAKAQSDSNALTCYEQKDRQCLEALYQDVVEKPTPEKSDAMH